ncbi:MAG: hypothetical protein ACP5RP_04270 [Candidatus Micrarchaeia archaeon]
MIAGEMRAGSSAYEISKSEIVQPSSLGISGERPFVDTYNSRIKGFFKTVINDNMADLENFMRFSINLKNENSSISRITLRSIVKKGEKVPELGFTEEARLPLGNEWSNHEIVYLGLNSENRKTNNEIIEEERRLLRLAISSKNNSSRINEVLEKGFSIEINSINDSDIPNITRLYQEAYNGSYIFELNNENINSLVRNPNSYTATARKDGRVVSIAIAEVATINMQVKVPYQSEQKLTISEISDAATFKEYRGNGLYQSLLEALFISLKGKVDVVFTETRAMHIGVLIPTACYFKNYGLLMQHCKISGDRNILRNYDSPYEDLNVWGLIL